MNREEALDVALGQIEHLDEGENVIVQYGNDKSSSIDILGYSTEPSAAADGGSM